MNYFTNLTQAAQMIQNIFEQQNAKLDLILKELQNMVTSLDNLTAQVAKNSVDVDAALAAIANSGATPAQLDALTKAIAGKDALIETALNMPSPTP